MLPLFIIDEIRKREKRTEQEQMEQHVVLEPIPFDSRYPQHERSDSPQGTNEPTKRGVVVLDL